MILLKIATVWLLLSAFFLIGWHQLCAANAKASRTDSSLRPSRAMSRRTMGSANISSRVASPEIQRSLGCILAPAKG